MVAASAVRAGSSTAEPVNRSVGTTPGGLSYAVPRGSWTCVSLVLHHQGARLGHREVDAGYAAAGCQGLLPQRRPVQVLGAVLARRSDAFSLHPGAKEGLHIEGHNTNRLMIVHVRLPML